MVASLSVALEYLNGRGDFWVKIRGAGCLWRSLRADSVHGLIYFGLYRSAPLKKRWTAKQIVSGYADGSSPHKVGRPRTRAVLWLRG